MHRELSEQVHHLDHAVQQRTLQLAKAEERFRHAFDASPLAQCIQTLDEGRTIEVNAAYERQLFLPRQTVIGQTPEAIGLALDPVRWRSLLQSLSEHGSLDAISVLYNLPNHTPRHMRCSARRVEIDSQPCAIWVIGDVTEQLLIEQQLRQAQKLEGIGRLAAGIAHDFNNLLTVILNYARNTLDADGLPAEIRADQLLIKIAAERAAALTRQLLVFSRQQRSDPQPLDLLG